MNNNTTNKITPSFNGTFRMRFSKNCSQELIQNFKNSFKPYTYKHSTITNNNITYDYFVCSNKADFNVANFIKENKGQLKTFAYFPNASQRSKALNPEATRFNTIAEMIGYVNNNRITKTLAKNKNFEIAKTVLEKLKLKSYELKMSYDKKSGVIKYFDDNGLELIISPQNANKDTFVIYKPQNGHGDVNLIKYNLRTEMLCDDFKTPDMYRSFFEQSSKAVQEFKSLMC